MSPSCNAVLDQYILCRAVDTQSIPIPAGFKAKIIIIAINIRILNQYPGRRIDIDPVGTRAVSPDIISHLYSVHRDVGGIQDVYRPDSRPLEGDVFNHDRSEEHTSELQSLMRISY